MGNQEKTTKEKTNMKPFRATYQKLDYAGREEGDPEEVLVIAIIAPKPYSTQGTAVFIHSDGSLDQDEIKRFTNCQIPWPHTY